jgi:hypothetical protein
MFGLNELLADYSAALYVTCTLPDARFAKNTRARGWRTRVSDVGLVHRT